MNAREKLKLAGQFDKESASACGEQVSKKLASRRKDYDLMVNNTNFRAPQGAFHKPGSHK